ncbi:MAG: GNAT family N-acetyltransferase [Acidobacteriaceae bacterium]|nr:GNAT family N-acetyltransferase [Acidobacteriaceae bacterium]MBV9481181.1 GNAT family N-acetyltransferase [Acidobacteriota bacterium]
MEIRSYTDHDWKSVLNICFLAFAPIHQSFQDLLGIDLFRLVYPDWKASHESYLRSLATRERDRLFVAEENGAVVGFIHYEMGRDSQSGKIGLNAVHPAHQRRGVGTLMYGHILDLMREMGIKYVQVGTGGDPSHAPARRAYEKFGFVPLPLVHYYKKL